MAAKWIFPRHAVLTICMNVSRFMNLAAIFSLDLESQYMMGWDGLAGYVETTCCVWETHETLSCFHLYLHTARCIIPV